MRFLATLLIACALFTKTACAQKSEQRDTKIPPSDDQLNLKKYHTNKTTAWTLAGTGIVLFGIGMAQPAPQYYINNDPTVGYPKRKGGALRIAGGLLAAASVPFYQGFELEKKDIDWCKERNGNAF